MLNHWAGYAQINILYGLEFFILTWQEYPSRLNGGDELPVYVPQALNFAQDTAFCQYIF